jgi:dipeptidyl aminopeptidase/acylaminoacyl peptidase
MILSVVLGTVAVIAFDEPYTHRGSQNNLVGEHADPALVKSLSNEKQVTPETPPTFLFHTDADTGVPAENSVQFYLACRRAGVPAELHIYHDGPHGVGLGAKIPGASSWPDRLKDWLQTQGFLSEKK